MKASKLKALHIADAVRLLKDGQPHKLRVWKLSTGELITYNDARFLGGYVVRGSVRIRLPQSALVREFKTVALFEIDDLKVYM